jgi:hypothetical protein
MLAGAGCAKPTRTGLMSAPVLSRASLSARARENSVRAECSGVVAVSWTRNKRLSSFRCVRAATRSLSSRPYRAKRSSPFSREGLDRRAYSIRSRAPRGSDSARWMPSASSRVRVAARRHAVSVTASGMRTLGSSSLVRPKRWRIGSALTSQLSTQAIRCGRTQPWTDDAMTACVCLPAMPSHCHHARNPQGGPSGRPLTPRARGDGFGPPGISTSRGGSLL